MKVDHAGKEALLKHFLGQITQQMNNGDTTGATATIDVQRASAKDLANLCVGFAAAKDRHTAKRFLQEVAVPLLEGVSQEQHQQHDRVGERSFTTQGSHSSLEDDNGVDDCMARFRSAGAGSSGHRPSTSSEAAPLSELAFGMDANVTSRMLNAFGKVLGSATPVPVVELLARSAKDWVSEMYTRELVNVALSVAKVAPVEVVGGSKAFGRTRPTATAPGKDNRSCLTVCRALMKQIRDRIVSANLLPTFNAQDYANFVAAFANFSTNCASEKLSVEEGQAPATNRDLATGSISYDFREDDAFHCALASSVTKRLKKLDDAQPQHVASLLWSFGKKLGKFDLVASLVDAELPVKIEPIMPNRGDKENERHPADLDLFRFSKPQELANTFTVLSVERPKFARTVLLPQVRKLVESDSAKLKGVDAIPLLEGYARLEDTSTEIQSGRSDTAGEQAEKRFCSALGQRCLKLREQNALDSAQTVFIFHAFCKLQWVLTEPDLLLRLLPDMHVATSGTPSAAALDANSLSLVLNGITHHLNLHHGSLPTAVPSQSSTQDTVEQRVSMKLRAVCRNILSYFSTGNCEVLENSHRNKPSKAIAPIGTALDFEGFLKLFYQGNANVDRSTTNLLQSLAFLAQNPASGPSATSAQQNTDLLRHLGQVVLQDSHNFSNSTLVQSIYAATQLSDQLPPGLSNRLLEKLSVQLGCTANLRASDCVAAANTLALANHVDEALLDRLARRLLETFLAAVHSSETHRGTAVDPTHNTKAAAPGGKGAHNASEDSATATKKFAWQFLTSCARLGFHSADVALVAEQVAEHHLDFRFAAPGEVASILSSLARLDSTYTAVRTWDLRPVIAESAVCHNRYSELLFFGYMFHLWRAERGNNFINAGNTTGESSIFQTAYRNFTSFVELLVARTGTKESTNATRSAGSTRTAGLPLPTSTTREDASQVLTGLLIFPQIFTRSFTIFAPAEQPTATSWAAHCGLSVLKKCFRLTENLAQLCTQEPSYSQREGDSEGDVMDTLVSLLSRAKLHQLTTQVPAGPYTIDLCLPDSAVAGMR
ncbi:unnamed protein product [Amoebophrya sp. A120]|nr:unnamed protein product [Amoebophrya sp. A120]|eukprot:GSA120T00011494001.1